MRQVAVVVCDGAFEVYFSKGVLVTDVSMVRIGRETGRYTVKRAILFYLIGLVVIPKGATT